jgi:DNA-binding response OmpR family regulator
MSSESPRQETTVLVVDDDIVSRIMLRRSLELYGYEVIEADDGEQALASIERQRPDLIVLDGVMPRMDGFSVVSHLRADDATRTIPILMLTSLQDVSYKVRGFELGADDFLNKPIDRVELIARVRSLLRIKSYHDELEQKNIMLQQALSRYVVEEVASEILAQPEQNLYLNGQSSTVSILYADLRGFQTYLMEHDAQSTLKTLNAIFTKLVPIVFNHRGTFNKYIGDSLIAFYGAPVPYNDDALRAAHTAIEMQNTFAALQQADENLQSLGLAIGIFTGQAVVGYIGSDQVKDYTVLGSPVSSAKGLGEFASVGQILIDPLTYEAVKEHVKTKAVEPIMLRRKGERLSIQPYEVLPT